MADGMMDSSPLEFSDLIPNPKMYDKMRPPKRAGEPTKVEFHVTVMGLDSINEYSMVRNLHQALERGVTFRQTKQNGCLNATSIEIKKKYLKKVRDS
jgi:hypothetical protein